MDGLDRLLADRVLGQATKLAFLFIWRDAGFDVNEEIIVSDTWLGQRLGRDRRSAQGWLQAMEDAELIEIRQRDRRRGQYRISVFRPCPGKREPKPDPQARLNLDESPAGEPTPRIGSRAASGEPTPRKPAIDNQPAGGREQPLGPRNEAGRAGVSAQESPRPYGTKEYNNSFLPNYQSTQSTKEGVGTLALRSGAGVSAQESPPDFLAARDRYEAAVAQRKAAARPREVSTDELCRGVVAGMVAASAPTEQRRRLMAKIQAIVREPLTEWVLGSAANLVAIHNVPVRELNVILGDVEAMRATGNLRSAAAFFHKKARDLAARHGVQWPRRAPVETRKTESEL